MKHCVNLILGFALSVAGLATPVGAAMSTNEQRNARLKVHYVEYAGKQQDWPTGDVGSPETRSSIDDLLIYQSLPNKPYEILGTIQASGSSTPKHVREAVRAVGADAVLVYGHKQFFDAGITLHAQITIRKNEETRMTLIEGVLIRWKR